jgi:hypothetical protein
MRTAKMFTHRLLACPATHNTANGQVPTPQQLIIRILDDNSIITKQALLQPNQSSRFNLFPLFHMFPLLHHAIRKDSLKLRFRHGLCTA